MKKPTKAMRVFAVTVALRAMVDRLQTIESDDLKAADYYAHGCIETTSAAIQDVASGFNDLGEISFVLGKFVKGLNIHTKLSDDAFGVMLNKVVEKYLA